MSKPSADVALEVSVERSKCCGYAICAEICPEVYKIDKDGFVYLGMEQVGADLAAAAREGAESCPELAISVREVLAEN